MANQCVSFRQFCGMLGYSLNSGSATTAVKECIEKYNLDCSHFTGQGWCKNNFDISKFVKGKKMNGTARILAFIVDGNASAVATQNGIVSLFRLLSITLMATI